MLSAAPLLAPAHRPPRSSDNDTGDGSANRFGDWELMSTFGQQEGSRGKSQLERDRRKFCRRWLLKDPPIQVHEHTVL